MKMQNGAPKNSGPPATGPNMTQAEEQAKPKWFKFLQAKKGAETGTEVRPGVQESAPSPVSTPLPAELEEPKKPSLLPGSAAEHKLQEKYGSKARAINFYEKQMLSYLAPVMKEFIARQEFLFVATADRHGECDCTPKFGKPGFIRVLSDKYLMYPEYRVMAFTPTTAI